MLSSGSLICGSVVVCTVSPYITVVKGLGNARRMRRSEMQDVFESAAVDGVLLAPVAGKYLSGRASLAGYFTGSMASELLGICGGLAAATTLANDQVSFVFYIDGQGALDQVFGGAEPGRDGLHNVPALKLARMLLHHLMAISPVQSFKVASHANYAHCIAKHEQRRHLTQDNWLSCCDVWPADMDDSWQSVFRLVASNTRAGPAGCVSELPSTVLQSFR